MTSVYGEGGAPRRPSSLVEWCVANVDPDARERLVALDHDCRPVPCLQRCGDCFDGPFLVVDGVLRTATSHADLVAGLEDSP